MNVLIKILSYFLIVKKLLHIIQKTQIDTVQEKITILIYIIVHKVILINILLVQMTHILTNVPLNALNIFTIIHIILLVNQNQTIIYIMMKIIIIMKIINVQTIVPLNIVEMVSKLIIMQYQHMIKNVHQHVHIMY